MKKIEAARDEVCTSSTPCCALFLCMRVEGCSLHCMHDVLLECAPPARCGSGNGLGAAGRQDPARARRARGGAAQGGRALRVGQEVGWSFRRVRPYFTIHVSHVCMCIWGCLSSVYWAAYMLFLQSWSWNEVIGVALTLSLPAGRSSRRARRPTPSTATSRLSRRARARLRPAARSWRRRSRCRRGLALCP